jgi:prevent-host-death family protein
MTEIGVSEARATWYKLLDRVAKGESVAISKHGVPVALLSPFDARRPGTEIIAEIRELRKGHTLDGLNIRDMIEEGRR